jgi:hypothetical protein
MDRSAVRGTLYVCTLDARLSDTMEDMQVYLKANIKLTSMSARA